jgi:hypothetical protein
VAAVASGNNMCGTGICCRGLAPPSWPAPTTARGPAALSTKSGVHHPHNYTHNSQPLTWCVVRVVRVVRVCARPSLCFSVLASVSVLGHFHAHVLSRLRVLLYIHSSSLVAQPCPSLSLLQFTLKAFKGVLFWLCWARHKTRVAAEEQQHCLHSGSFHVGEQSAQCTCF